jgi:transposase InsO family protein
MTKDPQDFQSSRPHQRWAELRFSVVGPLLASPPARGKLGRELKGLAARSWRHPITGQPKRFGVSTIERWYYQALRGSAKESPVEGLGRKIRSDHGRHPALSSQVAEVLAAQYRQHPGWSYQLHFDNLVALGEGQPELGPLPSYRSVLRFMKARGHLKRPRRGPVHSPGAQAAEQRYEAREIRSYESEYVDALWHLDFHHGSVRVLRPCGSWVYPLLLGILDDRSRLCCHLQWYLAQGARELCHGLSQAFLKRGLPRALLFDNGSAMVAKETRQGLLRLGVLGEHTLPYSPYQNGKQESFWGQIEGRLLPMMEGVGNDLSLEQLNEATLAWVEMEYNRKLHREIGRSPLRRYLDDERQAGRPAPDPRKLEEAFTAEATRTQRRSDGTVSVDAVRFEIPSRYGHLPKLDVRYASWDLSWALLCDPKSGAVLQRLHPQDKVKNAEARRARRSHPDARASDQDSAPQPPPASGMAPLLQKIMSDYAATGLPPAYLPGPEPARDSSQSS